jgi:hypothetical protein
MKTKPKKSYSREMRPSTHRGEYIENGYSHQALMDELELEEDWTKLYKHKKTRR